MTEHHHLQVVTTTDSVDAANSLAASAVGARVAACAQVVGPISSTYWWEGAVETAQEWQIAFKTTAERYPALEAHLTEHHTYNVPEIIATPIAAGNPAYLQWVTAATSPSA